MQTSPFAEKACVAIEDDRKKKHARIHNNSRRINTPLAESDACILFNSCPVSETLLAFIAYIVLRFFKRVYSLYPLLLLFLPMLHYLFFCPLNPQQMTAIVSIQNFAAFIAIFLSRLVTK